MDPIQARELQMDDFCEECCSVVPTTIHIDGAMASGWHDINAKLPESEECCFVLPTTMCKPAYAGYDVDATSGGMKITEASQQRMEMNQQETWRDRPPML